MVCVIVPLLVLQSSQIRDRIGAFVHIWLLKIYILAPLVGGDHVGIMLFLNHYLQLLLLCLLLCAGSLF